MNMNLSLFRHAGARIAAALMLFSALALPQSKTGTTVGQFLLIEPSARIAGMGNAGATAVGEASALYYNPAALGASISSDAEFAHSQWLAGIAYNYAAASIHVTDASAIGLSVTSLNSGEIAVRTVEAPLGTGERYTVSDMAIGVAYGQKITDRFSAGLQLNYIQETIWHSSLAAFGINFGTLYQITSDGLMLGASISNFGTRARYDGSDLRIRYDLDPSRYGDNSSIPSEIQTDQFPLPIVFRVGFGYPLVINESNMVHLAVDALHPSDNSESVSLGAEYVFMKTFALRAGYQRLFETDSEVGLTLGAGIDYELTPYSIRIDYGWATHESLGDMQRFSVGVSF